MIETAEVTLYKNHAGTVGFWRAIAKANEECGIVRIEYAKTLQGKVVSREYKVQKKNVGRSNETSFAEQALLELTSRKNKQIDKGYVESLEAASSPATNALGLKKPMLAKPINKVKPESIDWSNAFAQPKLDGHRCLSFEGLYSRSGKPIVAAHIEEYLKEKGLEDLHLDGELYVHGMLLQDIGSLIKKPQEQSSKLVYYVYDLISEAPYLERYGELLDRLGTDQGPVRLLRIERAESLDELDQIHKRHLSEGYEGTILRHGEVGYQDDKRSSNLLKVKDFTDTEFVVVGYEEGKPNGSFQVPIWVCEDANDSSIRFKVTAQGTKEEKHDQWLYRENYVGNLLTVQHFGYSKDGIPLLPVALRWREDI